MPQPFFLGLDSIPPSISLRLHPAASRGRQRPSPDRISAPRGLGGHGARPASRGRLWVEEGERSRETLRGRCCITRLRKLPRKEEVPPAIQIEQQRRRALTHKFVCALLDDLQKQMSPDFESRGVRTDAAFQDVKNVRCVKLSAPCQTLQEPRGKLDLTCTPQNHTLCCPHSLQEGPPVILARGCQALQVERRSHHTQQHGLSWRAAHLGHFCDGAVPEGFFG